MKYAEDLFKGSKNAIANRQIITYFIQNGAATIVDLAKVVGMSVPTVTKLVENLTALEIIKTHGKLETEGGRHPNLYGLNQDGGYFLGIAVENDRLLFGLINLNGEMIIKQSEVYTLADSAEGLSELTQKIKIFIDTLNVDKDKLLNIDISIPGRINSDTGYSYSFFYTGERSLTDYLSEHIGYEVCIDNDSRAKTYGEYLRGCISKEQNILYYNVSEGLGLGIIIDGKLYTGKSGFSGEIGHTYAYDNEILCYCGKKGCLETEVSGRALKRKCVERIEAGENSLLCKELENIRDVTMKDIIDAAIREDTLCIDLIQHLGNELGKNVANMINVFNPELVIIGGDLSLASDYLIEPVRAAVRRHSLNLVNKDSKIIISKLKDEAAVVGACMLARSRMFIL